MEKKLIEPFINLLVVVGVPHVSQPRPFFYFGKLTVLTDDYLVLEFEGGIKQIPLKDIIDIHLDRKSTRRYY